MSALSHVRLNPFKTARYTDAQAAELRQLRALYTTHLVPVFGPGMPDAFALETEGDDYYPRYTAKTLTPPPITAVPPSSNLLTAPYKAFADTLISTLSRYEADRTDRLFGKGHPNDPTRLLGIFLRSTCDLWLSHAASSERTLRQVTALRQYLDTLAREAVFTREGEGHDSMTVLLHNLTSPLSQLEQRLQYEISLQSAREHFNELKEGVSNALNEAAQYLFYALAVKDRRKLPFSLVNIQARVVNKPLSKAMETREGLLLKQWIHSPGVTRTLLPQEDAKDAKSAFTRKPISLFGGESSTPLLDEKGGAHPAWCEFLEHSSTLEPQLDRAVKKLPSGVCPVLLESKALPAGETSLLAEAVQLHGLLAALAGYQAYLQECWQLAGFGGDHCMYDQIAEAVVSILTELRAFNQALAGRLRHFQERLGLGYKTALDATAHLAWQANYRHAKAHQEKLLGMLTGCEAALTRVILHAQDTAARSERRVLAAKSYAVLKSATTFLNQTRAQVGLAPKAHYPGLETPDSKAALGSFGLSHAAEPLSFNQILVTLLPASADERAFLTKLCAETPSTEPWSGFRGRRKRYVYLHNNTRLEQIAQDLMYWESNAPSPMTSEKSAFINQLRGQLQEEQARIRQLNQWLLWPFQRGSRRFFATLQQAMQEQLQKLEPPTVLAAPAPLRGAPVSTAVVQSRLLVGQSGDLAASSASPLLSESSPSQAVRTPSGESKMCVLSIEGLPSTKEYALVLSVDLQAELARSQAENTRIIEAAKEEGRLFLETAALERQQLLESDVCELKWRADLDQMRQKDAILLQELRQEREAVEEGLRQAQLRNLDYAASLVPPAWEGLPEVTASHSGSAACSQANNRGNRFF